VELTERIKTLFRRRPLSEEELAARAEAESVREQSLQEAAGHASAHEANPPF
jgi:hypothetical protein